MTAPDPCRCARHPKYCLASCEACRAAQRARAAREKAAR